MRWSRLLPFVIASATLGLAPFAPEPHIVGKLRWIAGGAVGMKSVDWLDTAMHGAPWVALVVVFGLELARAARGRSGGSGEKPAA
jgi:hypothetical protein